MEPVITKELNVILNQIVDTIKAKNIDMTISLKKRPNHLGLFFNETEKVQNWVSLSIYHGNSIWISSAF